MNVQSKNIADYEIRDFRSFAFRDEALLPGLSDLQSRSYSDFLQMETAPGRRIEQGLQGLFSEIFPIESHDKTLALDFIGYSLGRPRYTPDECRELKYSYAYPLRVRLGLRRGEQCLEEEIFLGEIPVMMGGGEFIVNGSERVIVAQLHRSPGIDFAVEKHAGDKSLHSARIIPERGSWVEIMVSGKGTLQVRIDQQGKFSALTLLRALRQEWGTDEEILKLFYQSEVLKRPEKISKAKFAGQLENRLALSQIRDMRTGEVWAESGQLITEEAAERIAASDMAEIALLVDPEDTLILDSLKEDTSTSHEEALAAIYAKLRPGNPIQLEKARELLQDRFFDNQRYSLGRVGRFRINRKFKRPAEADKGPRTLIPQDFLDSVHYVLGLRNGKGETDDIDHLGNRRVRTLGEMAHDDFRKGLLKVARAAVDRMSQEDDSETLTPRALINAKPFSTSIEQFFARGELSQVVDQTNPLSQLAHERRLSALGPGGLNRKRAGFQERDVHISHYGRLCPIETPEGANIGLISSLALFAMVDDYGFLVTPYRIIEKGKATENIAYLRADEEYDVIFAPADAKMDGKGNLILDENGKVMSRFHGEFALLPGKDVEYLDIDPGQIIGISASLIPFLEHDDANRALMGSNMQRQAVPLVMTEPPLVGTGIERAVAENSGWVVKARRNGIVEYVDANMIRIKEDPEPYVLRKFQGTNEHTCLNQRPLVRVGQKVKKNEILADGPSTDNGELALGKNLVVAFMSWEGYNYEDAIVVSERLKKDDVFTSIHIVDYTAEIRETTLGKEEFTRDIPNAGERALRNLDESGMVRVGTRVGPNDILVGKIAPKSKTELTPEERLLHAIFGRAGEDVKNVSLKLPAGVRGIVIGAEKFTRKVNMTAGERKQAHEKIRQIESDYDEVFRRELTSCIAELSEYVGEPIKDPKGKNPIAVTETTLYGDLLRFQEILKVYSEGLDHPSRRAKAEDIVRAHMNRIEDKEAWKIKMSSRLSRGDDLPNGVLEMVKIYIATKRNLSVGDKMAGRHGNKGVISTILPVQDMPYLEDGTPVDIVLNPLGVPSRMNVGQILETHLGLAAMKVGFRAYTSPFDGANEADIEAALEEAGMDKTGTSVLYDGRTGAPFEQRVCVGVMYVLKLHHLVDEKVHARSTGPYSLITQQPLGGKARFGGQRLGEMEVWALEAYGAAYLLQELLTVKSDDVDGRTKIYEAMVKGKNILEPGTPVSFEVLMNEIRGLGLNIQLHNAESQQ
ncbi:MAG: DNA-directed RNA polymerase subunit beta [Planctomycetota bacterium]|nr:DNA-directed RNA polymerase subunit beta [Planctomycetota bacterium]MDA1112816.1 DNA-directed RNA polymerase subunit beta [Planctomycetota bacterium]